MDKSYWESYYTKIQKPFDSSTFAKFVLNKMTPNQTIIDLGCGNGRDSIYFSENKIRTLGVDQSSVAIKNLKPFESSYLNKLNAHNHTQAIIFRNGNVVAKETSKGTKKMLQILKKTKKFRGILIKYPKKKQDLRADLPTIGIDTLKDCKMAKIKGIVLKSNENIILDKSKCINFANKNKIFIAVK